MLSLLFPQTADICFPDLDEIVREASHFPLLLFTIPKYPCFVFFCKRTLLFSTSCSFKTKKSFAKKAKEETLEGKFNSNSHALCFRTSSSDALNSINKIFFLSPSEISFTLPLPFHSEKFLLRNNRSFCWKHFFSLYPCNWVRFIFLFAIHRFFLLFQCTPTNSQL